jgi:CheY-like chemotaxis protein
VELRENIHPSLGAVIADQTQIQQVLMNLCTNAFHAIGKKDGRIDVEVAATELNKGDPLVDYETPAGPYLRISVSDNGCGIDKATMSRIFEPYFTTKKIGEGTGLGLAMVHGIVKDHRGAISVLSEPGRGSAFHIYLPVAERKAKTAETAKTPLPGGVEKVLFVDDELFLVEIGKNMLEHLGYSVACRSSPIEALELFRNSPGEFDLVITDMTMPGMTGDRLVVELRGIRRDIPVIVCTGFSHLMDSSRLKEAGVSETLMKPLSIEKLALAIRSVLDRG